MFLKHVSSFIRQFPVLVYFIVSYNSHILLETFIYVFIKSLAYFLKVINQIIGKFLSRGVTGKIYSWSKRVIFDTTLDFQVIHLHVSSHQV